MERFTGPLGIWTFPILNAILVRLDGGNLRSAKKTGILSVSAENVEKWELVRDSSGKLTGLVIHREVKQ